jgi:RHS repeat-associated protein
VLPPPGPRTYYVYDGSDLQLTLGRTPAGTWHVRQRYLVGGVDQPLAGRFVYQNPQTRDNLALISDRQGTTLAAMRSNGTQEDVAGFFGRNPFGMPEGASGSGTALETETGFTGASTPNQTGGFTYLRNRWYDPQTGRFLTQDPIGLMGGINLYSYAGNNPIAFSDPFGLKPCWIIRMQMRRVVNSMQRRVDQYLEAYGRGEADADHLRQLGNDRRGFSNRMREYQETGCYDDDDHDDDFRNTIRRGDALQHRRLPTPHLQENPRRHPLEMPDLPEVQPPTQQELAAIAVTGLLVLVAIALLPVGI